MSQLGPDEPPITAETLPARLRRLTSASDELLLGAKDGMQFPEKEKVKFDTKKGDRDPAHDLFTRTTGGNLLVGSQGAVSFCSFTYTIGKRATSPYQIPRYLPGDEDDLVAGSGSAAEPTRLS